MVNFNAFVRYKILPKEETTALFNQFDVVIRSAARILYKHCNFISEHMLATYASLLSGSSRFKTLYNKERSSRVGMRLAMSDGYTKDDFNFLLNSYYMVQSKQFPIVYNRLVYYEVLEKIFSIGTNYLDILEEIENNNYSRIKELSEIEEELQITSYEFKDSFIAAKKKFDAALDIRFKIISPFFKYVLMFAGRQKVSSYQTTENFQVGITGLMRASLLYNCGRGTFGTYAKFWIKQAIHHRAYNAFMISIPPKVWVEFKQLELLRKDADNIQELAELSNHSVKHIRNVYDKVFLTQVDVLEQEEDGPETEPILETVNKYGNNTLLFNYLDSDELDLFLLMFGNYRQLEACNNITKEEIINEVKRQKGEL